MGLLTVYQLNLQPPTTSGGTTEGGGTPSVQQSAPQRFSMQYTVGSGFFTPPSPTTAPAPLLGIMGNEPLHPYIFGVDFDESGQMSVPAMTAGTFKTLTQTVALPDIPAIELDPTDSGSVQIIPHVYQNPIVSGLIIASVQVQAQALQSSTNQWVPADTLTPGQIYTAVRAVFTVGLYAATATVAATLTLGASSQVIIFSS